MSATQRRSDLLDLAQMLNKHRIDLMATINKINEATGLLVNEAEKLLLDSIAEREAGIKPTKIEKVDPQLEFIGSEAKQRHCSLCGEPGHTARTCTNGRKEKPEAAPAPKVKRKLSEERKAQLRETLKKARAAKGKKRGK